MKIAIINLAFDWPPGGGCEVDTKEIATRLKNAGSDVRVFVPDTSKILQELPFPIYKVHLRSLDFHSVPKAFRREVDKFAPDHVFIANGVFLKPYLVKAFKDYQPTVRIYAYEFLCPQGTLLKSRPCRPNSFRCTMCMLRYTAGSAVRRHFDIVREVLGSFALSPFYLRIARESLKHAGRIIVYNPDHKTLFAPLSDKIEIIPSGVNPEIFRPMKREGKGLPTLLMPGRAEDPVKGANVLLSACRNLRNKGKEFRLILTARKRFRRFREDWIETCWANHDEVHKLYQRSDICIVPSLWEEAQGIVAVEAMACGKPVIASRVGGLKYVVEDGKTGFLFKRGDISDLESKIEMLLDDKELREGMGENGRYKAATEYDWDVIFERYYSKMFC